VTSDIAASLRQAANVEQIAEILKALSDPTRLRLASLLGQRTEGRCARDACGCGPLCVNALASRLEISQPAVSQHLRVLKQAGLVRGERRGSFIHYSLDHDGIRDLVAALCQALNVRTVDK
jgi:ArsR family transcriptional regulator, arsenate/arsenite/antimonite-responsive transcriptional repressor